MQPRFNVGEVVYISRYEMNCNRCHLIKNIKIIELIITSINIYKENIQYSACEKVSSHYSYDESYLSRTKEELIGKIIKNFTEKFTLAITD